MLDNEQVELKNLKSLKRENEYIGIRQLRNKLIPNKEIHYNSTGKPFLQLDNRYISVSHSTQSICLGLSDFPLGIDLEKIDKRVLKVRSKYINIEDKNGFSVPRSKYLYMLLRMKLVKSTWYRLEQRIVKLKGVQYGI